MAFLFAIKVIIINEHKKSEHFSVIASGKLLSYEKNCLV